MFLLQIVKVFLCFVSMFWYVIWYSSVVSPRRKFIQEMLTFTMSSINSYSFTQYMGVLEPICGSFIWESLNITSASAPNLESNTFVYHATFVYGFRCSVVSLGIWWRLMTVNLHALLNTSRINHESLRMKVSCLSNQELARTHEGPIDNFNTVQELQ